MKVVVFGDVLPYRVGAWVGDEVLDLNSADPAIPSDLRSFIEAGGTALERSQRVIDQKDRLPDEAVVPFASVAIRAPWPEARVACVGGNYGRHLLGMNRNYLGDSGATLESSINKARELGQWGFWKAIVGAVGPDEDVRRPRRTRHLDFEGEVAIILGSQVRDFKGSRCDDSIFGVTLVNDWSIRDDPPGPPVPLSYSLMKNFDDSTSMGPCISIGELKYDDVPVKTRVNGELRQDFNSNEMIFSFAEVLEYLSRDMTLVPGDVISGGTCEGTAADSTRPTPDGDIPTDLFVDVGDVVEVSSPEIGVLRNRVV